MKNREINIDLPYKKFLGGRRPQPTPIPKLPFMTFRRRRRPRPPHPPRPVSPPPSFLWSVYNAHETYISGINYISNRQFPRFPDYVLQNYRFVQASIATFL